MSFFDWGSGGELLCYIPLFAPCPRPPSANHGKNQLLLYVLANIQYFKTEAFHDSIKPFPEHTNYIYFYKFIRPSELFKFRVFAQQIKFP